MRECRFVVYVSFATHGNLECIGRGYLKVKLNFVIQNISVQGLGGNKFDKAIYDMCHEKKDLKVFVVVIPKKELHPSLGMTPTIKYYSTAFIDYIL